MIWGSKHPLLIFQLFRPIELEVFNAVVLLRVLNTDPLQYSRFFNELYRFTAFYLFDGLRRKLIFFAATRRRRQGALFRFF